MNVIDWARKLQAIAQTGLAFSRLAINRRLASHRISRRHRAVIASTAPAASMHGRCLQVHGIDEIIEGNVVVDHV